MKQKSAGILFVHENMALLAHSTNSSWWNTWMPPKGHVEEDESLIDTAVRETEEEIGIRVDPSLLSDSFLIDYTDKRGTSYKEVFVFIVKLKTKIWNDNEGIKVIGTLQKDEVDQVMWMTSGDVIKRALPRYTEAIIKTLQNGSN
jgi:8-oxo-dGTP pyrophosphatase MutT (NUDIX family)